MSDRDIEDKLRTIAGSWRPGYDVEAADRGVLRSELAAHDASTPAGAMVGARGREGALALTPPSPSRAA